MRPGDIQRMIQSGLAGVRSAFRGVLSRHNTAPGVGLAQAEGLADEGLPGVEVFQHFGFTSGIPAGSQVIIIPLGGRTTHGVVIASENSGLRVTALEAGETCVYSACGDFIHLKNGNLIEVKTKTLNITADDAVNIQTKAYTCTAQSVTQDAPDITHSGATALNNGFTAKGGRGGRAGVLQGTMEATEDVIANNTSLHRHTHVENNNAGGDTQPPT